MRVVLDTNVIISGLLWKGIPKVLFDFVEQRVVQLCLTTRILNEVERVLGYPKIKQQLRLAQISPAEIMAYLYEHSILFADITIVDLITEDPSDNMFIDCALLSNAQWIVSGDEHLLKLKQVGDIKIVKPSEFLKYI